MPGPRRPRWRKRSIASPSCSMAAPLPRAPPRVYLFLIPTPKPAARWKRQTAPCMCARRCGGTRRRKVPVIASEAKQSISRHKERMDCFASLAMTALQPAEIIRYITELAQQFRVAEFTHHGIAAAAEGDGADAAGGPGHRLGPPQRDRRALAFFRGARHRRAAIVLQEWHCNVISDIGHWFAPGLIDQAASLSAWVLAGTQPAAIAACNSSSSVSRYSFAMISALMVERRLPSHIAMA